VSLCSREQAAAHACPESSKVGEAQAYTPLLPVPLSGGVFITYNPTGLPTLTVDLQGLLALQLTGNVLLDGGIQTTFDGIPDVPLSRFVLRFNGGPGGLLQTSTDLCAARGLELSGSFTAHNGATSTTTAPLRVEGCAPSVGGRASLSASVRSLAGGRPTVTLAVRRASGAQRLKGVVLTLPKGLKFDRRALARGLSGKAGSRRLAVSGVRVSGRTLTIAKLPGKTAETLRLVLRRGAVVADSKLRKRAKSRPSLAFAARVTDAKGARFTVKKTVRGR
jgi:hypothetical protein